VAQHYQLVAVQGEEHHLHRHHHKQEGELHDHQNKSYIVTYICNIVVEAKDEFFFFYLLNPLPPNILPCKRLTTG
jgi:hypothetical protein